jgi:hypothetical protein
MKEPIINKIKVETIYSEEVGLYVADFHYRFEKELNMATDHSTGEPSECYAKVTIQYKEPIAPDKLKRWHESRAPLAESVSHFSNEELSYITPISREEYEQYHQ